MEVIGFIRLQSGKKIEREILESMNIYHVKQVVRDVDPLSVIRTMEENDTLVVPSLVELSDGLTSLFTILIEIYDRGIKLISIQEQWLTLDSERCNWRDLFEGLGQLNSEIVSQRTKQALAKKKEAGHKLGRPLGSRAISNQKLRQGYQLYQSKTMSIREICLLLDLNVRSFYRYRKEQR